LKNSKKEFKLKPEDKLILNCGHSQINDELEKKIIKLVNLNLDWEYIVDMATRHRLRPLLYYNLNKICPDKVPEDVLASLREFYHSNVRKNLMMTGELVKVMKLLEENGVNAVTYKGPVLAQMAYGNVGYREFGDLDIFIKKEDALKSKNTMISNEYCLNPPIKLKNSIYVKLDSEYRFESDSGALIEINWNFEGIFFFIPFPSEFLFNESITFEINNFNINTVNNENQFLMLNIHCAKHDWNSLIWICDLSEFLKNKSVDWELITEKAKYMGVKRIFNVNMLLLKDLFGLEVPKEIEQNLDPHAKKMVLKIKKRLFQKDGASWNLIEKFFLDLKKRENLKTGLTDCKNSIFKPSYKDYNTIKLPEYLFTAYPLIRPFLLLKRYYK
jgi:hypothetical protein